ncbi:hypothetical protein DFJ58DRAFT_847987 [Suillus subalutaceus]|uniref:uncharacterized protein n=1 Tax=Suillus subalutaceus TaxID=48586 RepID=UPI001B86DA3F|nr:uncharacterized protein DFJ58DRAFT_847987 [Suillus subalutaceus]KAG1832563.1 hypothetical protein DFJ58DRAFT_847987 [Suillus subalutaceus]
MIARRYTNRYLDTEKNSQRAGQTHCHTPFIICTAQTPVSGKVPVIIGHSMTLWLVIFAIMSNTQRSMQVRTTQRQMTQISVTGNLMTCLMMVTILQPQLYNENDTSSIHDSDDSGTDEEHNSRPQKKLKFAHVSIPARAKPAPAPRTKPAPKSRMTQAPSRHLDLPLPTPTCPDPPPATKSRPISSSDTRTTKVATEGPSTTKPKATAVPIPRSTRAKTKPKPLATEASAAHLKPESIQVTPVPRPKPSRARPARRRMSHLPPPGLRLLFGPSSSALHLCSSSLFFKVVSALGSSVFGSSSSALCLCCWVLRLRLFVFGSSSSALCLCSPFRAH